MAIEIIERVTSRETIVGDNPRIIFHFNLAGTASDLVAKAELRTATPVRYDFLTRDSLEVDPIWVDEETDTGEWDCTVTYAGEVEPGDFTTSFDTTGGTQHITHIGEYGSDDDLRTISIWPASAISYRGAIGVTGEGPDMSVEGVDIVTPTYRWSESHRLADNVVTNDYRERLFILTARFNQEFFRQFLPGEVLFMGAVGAKTGYDVPGAGGDPMAGAPWEINFYFGAQMSVGLTDQRATVARPDKIMIGDIEVTQKHGWDYLWADYRRITSGSQMGVKPRGAYVERVYRPGDFSWLEIGT